MIRKEYPSANFENYRISRNPYAGRVVELQNAQPRATIYGDAATEQQRGKWREHYGMPENTFLQLELGAYHGETALALARQNPTHFILAAEWKFKQCYRGGKKAFDQKITNLCFLRANMARLPWVVAPGEVDRIWILFPDPWSGMSQQKWRILQPEFLRTLACLLKEGKELMIKTDHAEYAEFICKSITEAACFDYMSNEAGQAIFNSIPPTHFEKFFLKQNIKINSFALRRNGNLVVPPTKVQQILH